MNDALYQTKRFLNRNASTILTCIGGMGVIATTVMAVKATPKALKRMEEAKEKKGEDLTKFEVIKTAAPVYIPSVIAGTSTIACIFGANMLNQRNQAALMSAYALLDNSYKEYKNKVTDVYGEEADTKVRSEIASDKYEESHFVKTSENTMLFYEDYYGMFEASKADVLEAELEVNRLIQMRGYVSLNEFYALIGLPERKNGNVLGWSIDLLDEYVGEYWIDFKHEDIVLHDGSDCYMITPSISPLPDFMMDWE